MWLDLANPLNHFDRRGLKDQRAVFVNGHMELLKDYGECRFERHIALLHYKPLISVVMPVYNPKVALLS